MSLQSEDEGHTTAIGYLCSAIVGWVDGVFGLIGGVETSVFCVGGSYDYVLMVCRS